jgi:hypothetical protein
MTAPTASTGDASAIIDLDRVEGSGPAGSSGWSGRHDPSA